MIRSAIKAIIFDLGKVIIDFDHHAICRQLSAFCSLPPQQLYEIIFLSGLEARFDRGELSPEAFFDTVVKTADLTIGIDLFRKIWSEIFSLNPGIDRLIQNLAGHYRLLCLSNTNVWQFDYCRRTFAVLDYFEDFILSFQMGQRKPHPDIYQSALAIARAKPWECVYIDDIAEFVEAAQQLGMHGIQFVSVEATIQALRRLGVNMDCE
jgi:putative hydrolase of the HAD superfamily